MQVSRSYLMSPYYRGVFVIEEFFFPLSLVASTAGVFPQPSQTYLKSFGAVAVILSFFTRELRELCESQVKSEREFGLEVAQQLRARLADMRAAENALDLVAGQPGEFVDGEYVRYKIDLPQSHRIILRTNHDRVATTDCLDSIDWSKVWRVQILRIEKTEVMDA
jgi:hypothetical protein